MSPITRLSRRDRHAIRTQRVNCKNFGPREDEDGEGLNPDDPSDGDAIRERNPYTGTPLAFSGAPESTSPDAEIKEGAESSRVGGPSIRLAEIGRIQPELGRLQPLYGPAKHCSSSTCQKDLNEELGAYLYRDLEGGKLCVFCGDCARHVELNYPDRFKLVAL